MGEYLLYEGSRTTKSASGFETHKDIYKTNKCSDCPYNEICTKGKPNKTIYFDRKWQDTKNELKEQFETKETKSKYKTRSVIEQN